MVPEQALENLEILYRSTGYPPAEKITTVPGVYMRDWEDWDRTGKTADWMK